MFELHDTSIVKLVYGPGRCPQEAVGGAQIAVNSRTRVLETSHSIPDLGRARSRESERSKFSRTDSPRLLSEAVQRRVKSQVPAGYGGPMGSRGSTVEGPRTRIC